MRTAEVVVARRILHQFRVLRNADPQAYQSCVDRVLAGLREDARTVPLGARYCPHGSRHGHWLDAYSDAYCDGPDAVAKFWQTNGITA